MINKKEIFVLILSINFCAIFENKNEQPTRASKIERIMPITYRQKPEIHLKLKSYKKIKDPRSKQSILQKLPKIKYN